MGFGDELMITGQARVMQQTDPRRVRVVYEKGLIWHDAWDQNPRIARINEQGDFQELIARQNYLRPYMESKTRERYVWRKYGPARGELYFTGHEREYGERHAGHVIVEPHIKPGASPNKRWPWMHWNKLVWLLGRAGVRCVQLGRDRPVEGVEQIDTPTIRYAAAIMQNSRLAILPEGGLMHVAAAVSLPAVVIFGGFISPAVTGYPEMTNIFTGTGLGCGSRVTCECCIAAMAAITPERVCEDVLQALK